MSADSGTFIHVDLSGVRSERLQQELRSALAKERPLPIRERDGAWDGPGAWVHQIPDETPQPALLFSDLSAVARAITPRTASEWLTTSRRRRLWVVAFLAEKAKSEETARIEGILRSLDGRLSLVAEPRFSLVARRWKEAGECVRNTVALLEDHALLDVRTLPDPFRFLVRFGDGLAGVLTPEQLGLDGLTGELSFHSAAPGSGGRTLQIAPRPGGGREGVALDAEFVRTLVDQAGGDRQAESALSGSSAPVGARIRAARRFRQLSQAELGRRIGMDQAVISNLERGVHSPRTDTLKRVARGLGMSLSELLTFPFPGG
jgi:DNA-binding XRE family transcriptional regulator